MSENEKNLTHEKKSLEEKASTTPKVASVTSRENTTSSNNASPTPPLNTTGPTLIERRSRNKAILFILWTIIVLGVGASAGLYITRNYGPNATPSLTSTNDGNTTITQEEGSIATIAEKVGPSVVSIVTTTESRSYFGTTSGEAAGTGIIISKDGYVITNNHVISSARTVSVVDSKGELYKNVEVIGRDPLNDVAFLKINSDATFTPASLGNSATIRTGQQVVAIGNALGQYSNTVTSGIISGTGRPITASAGDGTTESLTDLIQTDASINSGNSGGPLVNMAGQVIGINTAIVEDANGIGFAIPINSTKGILAGVLETGKVSRAFLGVNYVTLTPDVVREFDLSVNAGAYIYASASTNPVAEDSPADKAGLKRGDIITKINGSTLGKDGSLSSILGQYRPGDKLTLTYLRDGSEKTTSLTLDAYKS